MALGAMASAGAAPAARPNVLWLFTDEHRTDSLGCYGSRWARTPALDRLAAEGVRLANAVTPAPVCGPARMAMLTGKTCAENGVWYNLTGDPPDMDCLTRHFEEAGYRTAGLGRNHWCCAKAPFQTAWTKHVSPHVGHFAYAKEHDEAAYDVVKYPGEPYPWIFGGTFPADPAETSEVECIERGKRWLEEGDGRPFFLRLAFNAPHTPVSTPAPFDTLIDEADIRLPGAAETASPAEPAWVGEHLRRSANGTLLSPEQVGKMRRYYYGLVAWMDHILGELLEWMDARGYLENTIVVFNADHGTHLADFGLVQKQTFFEPSVRVPYIFWWPGGFAGGKMLETPVETRTLLPTLMDAAGIAVPEELRGLSLAEALRKGTEPASRPVYSMLTLQSFSELDFADPLMMVREGPLKLTVRFDPDPCDLVLVDLDRDPYERENRVDWPDYADAAQRLLGLARAQMDAARPRYG